MLMIFLMGMTVYLSFTSITNRFLNLNKMRKSEMKLKEILPVSPEKMPFPAENKTPAVLLTMVVSFVELASDCCNSVRSDPSESFFLLCRLRRAIAL